MDRAGFLIEFFGRKSLSVILASVLLLTTALSQTAQLQANQANKQKIISGVAQRWIQVGTEQYRRAFYKSAEKSFLRAREYQEYLTAAESGKLSELLEKTRTATRQRNRTLEHKQRADELVEQGELIKAKAHLEKVKGSEFLTRAEREQIAESLRKIDNQLNEQKKEIGELYNRSVELYRTGQLEKAREGFIKVAENGLLAVPAGKTAEDYLMEIDSRSRWSEKDARRVKPLPLIEAKPEEKSPWATVVATGSPKADLLAGVEAEPAQKAKAQIPLAKPGADRFAMVAVAEPMTGENGHTEVINHKRKILRSYIKAVVNDAVAKAQNYISEGRFYKAKEAVEVAQRAVSKSRSQLGDELFRQYSSQLKQLTEQVVRGRTKWLGSWDSRSAWRP